ncbi:MAG: hypothetical protein IPM55_14185 [Acidobacteria bacterium]|nr:hypothetical protein [Acidobacteriota bacterium]
MLFEAIPIDQGLEGDQSFLILFGTGIRSAGASSSVTATIGAIQVEALYAGPQNDFTGLDQINLKLPATLTGSGDVEIQLIASGMESNSVMIRIK